MIVNDSSMVSGLSLTNVEVEDGLIRMAFKNGATFIFSPQINDEEKVDYQMEYLTGKENKQIKKLQVKIQGLEDEIKKIIDAGTNNAQEEYIDEIDEIDEIEEI